MSKTVLIVQSNYLPWRGYFDMVRQADLLVLYDSVQYTRRDWRNRNRIKTPQGAQWITVPVEVKGRYDQAVDDTRIADPAWAEAHKRSIELAYRRAPAFEETAAWLMPALDAAGAETHLSSVNEGLQRAVMERLGIRTVLCRCTDLLDRAEMAEMDASERLLALCRAAGATTYLSGPAAKPYLDESLFHAVGMQVAWMDYSGYPDYPQLWGEFEPRVSVVDLFFNTGAEASRYLERAA